MFAAKIINSSAQQTRKIAKELACKSKPQIICLIGPLGSGKTMFVKGFCQGLGVRKRITSPSFIIMKKFQIPNAGRKIYHIDCYRLKKAKEILKLGFKEIINEPKSFVLIEWAEKIKKILPQKTLDNKNIIWIKFEYGDKEKERILTFLN